MRRDGVSIFGVTFSKYKRASVRNIEKAYDSYTLESYFIRAILNEIFSLPPFRRGAGPKPLCSCLPQAHSKTRNPAKINFWEGGGIREKGMTKSKLYSNPNVSAIT